MEENTTELFPQKSIENEITTHELFHQCILANNCKKMEDLKTLESLKLKTPEEIQMKQEALQSQLNDLKKENFCIQASVFAWQKILNSKLEEFKEADFTLNEVYNAIWAERENFCSKVDDFNQEFGVLSKWWSKQIKFVSELENFEKKTLENKKCQEEIKKLEEMNELEKKIHKSQKENNQHVIKVDVHKAEYNEASRNQRNEEPEEEVVVSLEDKLNPKSSETHEHIEMCEENIKSLKNELFSMVDMETVRMANRKHRSSKNNFITRIKKFLKK